MIKPDPIRFAAWLGLTMAFKAAIDVFQSVEDWWSDFTTKAGKTGAAVGEIIKGLAFPEFLRPRPFRPTREEVEIEGPPTGGGRFGGWFPAEKDMPVIGSFVEPILGELTEWVAAAIAAAITVITLTDFP